jgi:hypothetical protein
MTRNPKACLKSEPHWIPDFSAGGAGEIEAGEIAVGEIAAGAGRIGDTAEATVSSGSIGSAD